MKKIATLALVAALAATSQAVQINWGSSGQLFNGTQAMTTLNGYSTTGYLVYLGTAGATWESSGVDVQAIAATATKTASAAGIVSATSGDNPIFTWGSAIPNGDGASYTDGNSVFGIVFVSSNAGVWGADPHYITSGTFLLQTSGATWNATAQTATFTQAVPNNGSLANSWTPVPEPATGALALAGAALLLRRRRRA